MTGPGAAKATPTDYINLQFSKVSAECPLPTLEEWLTRAWNEHTLFCLAAAALDNDDNELGARFRPADANAIIEFYDSLVELQQTYKAGVKMLNIVLVRLLAAMGRVHMQGSIVA